MGLVVVCAVLGIGGDALALPTRAVPASAGQAVLPLAAVDNEITEMVDLTALAMEDRQRDEEGLPFRFAVRRDVTIVPARRGTWEWLDGKRLLWRQRINSPGALSINLGFTRYRLPWGARLLVYPAGAQEGALEFTAADNKDHGQLWTPVVLADDVIVELELPAARRDDYELELTVVNHGYRGFGETPTDKMGDCNIDVICPEGDDWRAEIASVAVYTINGPGGSLKCSGAMINNTAGDATPYFMTAYHCIHFAGQAPSVVVYWNYESPQCGDLSGGNLDDAQSGATLHATDSASDFTLLELDDLPDEAWGVIYAGWDRRDRATASSVTIHHPSTDEKCISFDNDPSMITSYQSSATPGNATHLMISAWDQGTTEPGSSGAPLFSSEHRIVGQLHGGSASCTRPDDPDWYGRFFTSWTGDGDPESRLSDWLDPSNTGVETLDGLEPNTAGLAVSPAAGLEAEGDVGGPFSPASVTYTLFNRGSTSLDYAVTSDVNWVLISDGSGSIAAAGSVEVEVSIAAAADDLPAGIHRGVLTFTNQTDGVGDTSRAVTVQAGQPQAIYTFSLDTDPGWQTQGQWTFGTPQGLGGSQSGGQGGPDPTAGHTGANVLGYNLAGNYTNDLPATHLTSTPIDCTGLSEVKVSFWRWLGVERRQYDSATLSVSNDGQNFTEIWTNSATQNFSDGSWMPLSYDISAVADDQAAVTLRWTMGPTDSGDVYCGWNLDDIQIKAFGTGPGPDPDPDPTAFVLMPSRPNPFPRPDQSWTWIRFDLPLDSPLELAIYDIRGRQVKALWDGPRSAGRDSLAWNGTDDDGRRVSGGVYICRMKAAGQEFQQKMTYVP